MTGYSIQELLDFPHSINLVHPEDQATVQKIHQDRIAGRPVPTTHVHRIIKKDGDLRWVEVSAHIVQFNGRPAVQVLNMDITKRRMAEDALRRSEKLLSDILDGSPIPMFVIGKDHRIIKWNKALEEYSGIRANEIIGTDQQWRPFYKEKRPLMADLLIDGKEERLSDFYIQYAKNILVEGSYEGLGFFPALGKDGTWLHFTASIIKDSKGVIIGALETLKDITEWKRTEEELRESREYLAQIINQISDPIFVKDSEHKYVLVNNAMCTFEGRTREQLLGHNSFEEHDDALTESLIERESEVLRTGEENISEDVVKDSQGKNHSFLAKKAFLVDKKGNRQIVGVLRDITEYKRLEAQFMQAQKMDAIGALAGGVAHDFNNLLNVINGYCELVLEDLAEDNPVRKDIQQISLAGIRAQSLTAQLLAFSRKQILQPAVLDLNNVIEDSYLMLRRLIPENIDLVISPQPDLGMIYADPGQIQQILMNLVVNARDAMPQGGKVTIETANVDYDDEYVRSHPMVKTGSYEMIAISDNGVGMDETTKSRLFEPFYTTKGKGTGLGLSIVYGIVKQSDGFIWVYSEPGQGATFKVNFPRVEGKASKLKEEIESEEMAQGIETVLIAEDESSIRSLAARILRERGYTVLEASNGQEALEVARAYAGEILLVITDVIMPEMNGKDLVAQLENGRPQIKVLYISGYTDNAIVHHGILDSGIAFLQKPFTVLNLARKVREVLDS